MLPINNIGMSIDKNGDLILIKGDSYDLFKGMFKKYTTGYKYKTSQLKIDKFDKKFESLYMDDDGILVGIEQITGRNI
jgi:fatty acid-binding protein DegV